MAAKKRPSKPMKEYTQEDMRNRSARAMTAKELEAELMKKYGMPSFSPMSEEKAIKQFQDVVSESSLWNYPGVKKAAANVASKGWQASAEADYKKRAAQAQKKQAQKKK